MQIILFLYLVWCTLASPSVSAFSFNWALGGGESNGNARRSYKVVCYYTNWAQYRPMPATFFPENVDAKLCTHVIFAFAKISDNYTLQAFEWNDESTQWSPGMYQRVMELKRSSKGKI